MVPPLGMIISQMLMCEVPTKETNRSEQGLNAEYEFEVWLHTLVAGHPF